MLILNSNVSLPNVTFFGAFPQVETTSVINCSRSQSIVVTIYVIRDEGGSQYSTEKRAQNLHDKKGSIVSLTGDNLSLHIGINFVLEAGYNVVFADALHPNCEIICEWGPFIADCRIPVYCSRK